jgi:hypothetical protein
MARANMIHATMHWPRFRFISLWPLAMTYAIWCYNKIPTNGTGWSPEELWARTKSPRSGLPRAHVFGCPVYVLDPKLQDGGKIPKRRAELGTEFLSAASLTTRQPFPWSTTQPPGTFRPNFT